MTAFEFVFPLFGLLVGLSFAEMLAGLARALKRKREVSVGWLTPLLGILILTNLTMIWLGAWDMRYVAEPSSSGMLFVLIVGGTYFLAASMVFPAESAEVSDLDTHFLDNRKVALLAIAACNLLYLGRLAIATSHPLSVLWWVGNVAFLGLLLISALASNRRVILAALTALILAHAALLLTN